MQAFKASVINTPVSAMRVSPVDSKDDAFTLVELIITIAILAVLAGLLLPTLSYAKDKAKRIACLNNLRQLGMASQVYAHDDLRQSLSAKSDSEDQDLNWLNVNYVNNPRVFLCPNTMNSIRTNTSVNGFTGTSGLFDLLNLAPNRFSRYGCSYQGMGFAGVGVDSWQEIPVQGTTKTINGIRKSLSNVLSYRHFHDAFGLKGTFPGPTQLWLIMDQTLPGTWYYPDPEDNHSDSGSNVSFCDGHVEWVKREDFIFSYERSQDEDRTGIRLTW